jgi:hypothetical protein
MISKLPGHLPVFKPSEVPYGLPNSQSIPFAFLSESQPLTGSPTLFLEYAPGDCFPKWTAHLQAVPVAALWGKAHDARIRHGRITYDEVWAYRSKPLEL